MVVARSPKGARPAGLAVETVDVAATVEAIDKKKRTMALKLLEGKMVTTTVEQSMKAFDTLKKDDSIHAGHTEAIAISVKNPERDSAVIAGFPCLGEILPRRPHEGSRLPVKYNNGEEITMNQRSSGSMMSRKRFWVFPVIVAFIMTAFFGAVQAGEPDEQSGWEFQTALYLWALSLDGDVTVKGRKSDVDVGFGDILDELNFAGMIAFSGRKGHWGFWGDVIYANLGHSTHIGLIPVDPDMDMLMLTGGGGYRLGTWALSDRPGKEVPTVAVDALVGVRYTYLDVKLDFDFFPDLRGDQGWVDPLIGVQTLWHLSRRWDLSLGGSIGGFGVGSDFTWSALGLIGYRFGLFGEDNAQVFGGYRALSQDYDTGSGFDKFEWDVIMHGPILGLTIGF